MPRLCRWPPILKEGLCLSGPFDNSPQDRWEGHEVQRKSILDFISNENIKNVVFLSGDVHVAFAFKLIKTDNQQVIARQITSSAFNWGIGLNDCNFGQTSPLKGTNGAYKPESLTGKFITKDNFCRVVVDEGKVMVNFYDAKSGESLRYFDFSLE
ncbi:MAG: hypothetical protein A6F71_07620 [Cycloclasticus sp. symbiont of Poecilosclerida sp. M]|nr:MAG: hypothetical protein A6F71_07620 [Cycloclasticus sp. symbiont of Poecilosclerida sp. M]